MGADLVSARPLVGVDRQGWLDTFAGIRTHSLDLAAPLSAEDQQVQSMADVSPTKWHLAHTTWFFETFLLEGRAAYAPFDDRQPRPRSPAHGAGRARPA